MYGTFTTTNGSNGMIQASSNKLQAPSLTLQYLESVKLQAPSDKRPNQSNKHQASSRKLQAP